MRRFRKEGRGGVTFQLFTIAALLDAETDLIGEVFVAAHTRVVVRLAGSHGCEGVYCASGLF